MLKTNEGGMWILPQICELERRGHDVTVIIPPGDGKLRRALDSAGSFVAESPFDFSFRLSSKLVGGLLQLRRVIKSTRPDALFYHLYASALAARIASVGLPTRRVHMVAGPLYLESVRIRIVERFLCRLDQHVIAGSEYTAERYRALGLPKHRLTTVPYGVNVVKFRKGYDDRVRLFGCPTGTFVVIMAAYVYAPKSTVFPGVGIKGHDTLLDAWDRFCLDHSECLLVLAGSGFDDDGERHRQRLVRDHAVANNSNVLWLDSVADVRPLYSSADLSVSPSLSENHGAALESSAMGLPSIVSDAGALPETVTTESGWVIRAGDAQGLSEALGRAHSRWLNGHLLEMGTAARRLCETRFSHDVVIPQIVDAVVGRSGTSVLAFTEQRTWLSGGEIRGRKPLPIVSALAVTVPVRLAGRVGASESGGFALAPDADPAALTWPAAGGLVRAARTAAALCRSIVREVRSADVIYADQPGVVGGMGLLVGRALRKPLVVNVVGDANESVHPSVISGIKGRIAHAILPRLQRWACANATYVNYVTSSVLQTRYPPIRAKQAFASTTATALGPARARPFPRNRVSVVTVASLEQPYKGVSDLIDVICICRSNGYDVRLTVIGEGRLRPQLETRAKAVIPGLVEFVGYLYGEAVYEELSRHDVFALASWTEGLPRALIEAMADGLPAVATGVGGVPELIEPERIAPARDPHGFADRLMKLLSDEGAWSTTIDHNLKVSGELLQAKNDILEGFVIAVASLAVIK